MSKISKIKINDVLYDIGGNKTVISTGSTNGTINVNTDGTSSDVAVKGLKSAAYTESSAYAAASHTHNYAGSSSAGGAANSANKLNTNAGSQVIPVYFKDGLPVEVKTNLPTNTVVTSAEESYLKSPMAKYLWHDLLAFGRVMGIPKYYITSDKISWSETTCPKNLFANKENSNTYLFTEVDNIGSRFVWSQGVAWNSASWLVIGWGYTNPSATVTVILEVSDDGETWVNILNVTGDWTTQPAWFKIGDPAGRTYMRLTITKDDDGITSNKMISSIKLLTSRWGNQGMGSEYEYPYDWDADANILPLTNNEKYLGSNSKKWKNVYSTEFTENGTTLANKYAAKSHTHDDKVDKTSTGVSAAINLLGIGTTAPVDNDYYISQYVNGGTTTTTYHRRPMSALWEYIKGKISSVLGLTATSYSGKAASANNADKVNNHTVEKDVPSDAQFTDTTYEFNTSYDAETNKAASMADFKYTNFKPLASKSYTGLYASANNNGSGADFMPISLTPANNTDIWSIRFKMRAEYTSTTNNGYYNSDHVVELFGYGNTVLTNNIWNNIKNTSYRPLYYAVVYRPSTVGNDLVIGFSLYNCNNNTLSNNARNVEIDVLSVNNCEFVIRDSCANTDYTTYYKNMTARNTYDCYNNGLQETGDGNSYANALGLDSLRVYAGGDSGTVGIYGYNLIMQDSTGKWQSLTKAQTTATKPVRTDVGFIPDKIMLYWNGGNINSGSLSNQTIRVRQDYISVRYVVNTLSFTAYKPIYLVGEIRNNLFYIDQSMYVQDLPYVDDGKVYAWIGWTYDTTNGCISLEGFKWTYYKDGRYIPYSYIGEASQNGSGLMSADDKKKLDSLSPSEFIFGHDDKGYYLEQV